MEQIISSDLLDAPITTYGSSESHSKPVLRLTHIWSHITLDMLINNTQPEENLLEDAFVPQNNLHVRQNFLNPKELTLIHWLPLFLSINYWCNELQSKDQVQDYGRFINQKKLIAGENITSPINFADQ